MIYHSRKYTLNEGFFSSWSPKMAYVLGYWYADGNLRHSRSYRIQFYSNDIDHLLKIGDLLSSNSPLDFSKYPCAGLAIRSKRTFQDILALGGVPRKSTKIIFPKVPDEFIADFIRGYFDGDGSVHKVSYIATKNHKIYTHVRSNFTSGSKIFLEAIKRILTSKLGLFKKKICQYGPHQFKLGYGQADTFKLLKFLYYPGHLISLERKAVYLSLIP